MAAHCQLALPPSHAWLVLPGDGTPTFLAAYEPQVSTLNDQPPHSLATPDSFELSRMTQQVGPQTFSNKTKTMRHQNYQSHAQFGKKMLKKLDHLRNEM